ncbi:hypothetical protein E2C01_043887 [Portunus trituberculatus]|uniref:Uncharacterized protein n=1 Tax=Portunus trituberculatus TaxID=210409 RepID=A0A5B7FXK4_PORTR|nr:hypothetical protein [Portunus trituberculatus]
MTVRKLHKIPYSEPKEEMCLVCQKESEEDAEGEWRPRKVTGQDEWSSGGNVSPGATSPSAALPSRKHCLASVV